MVRKQFYPLLSLALALTLTLILTLVLHPGTSNAAPSRQTDGQVYIIKAGDSLYKISGQIYGDAELWPRILEATNAKSQEDSSFALITDPKALRVGQKLWIPNLDTETAGATQAGETNVEQRVFFIKPSNLATVTPTFVVETGATGLTLEPAGDIHPNAGHMHILIDTDFVPAGELIIRDDEYVHLWQGQASTTITLTPGIHILRLQFSDSAHIALDGDQYHDMITVIVTEDASAQSVRFVAPQDGDIVSTTFTVETAATGLTLEPAGDIHPNAGHMHVLLDTDFVPAGELIIRDDEYVHLWRGEPTTTITLTPGVHVLRLQFSDSAHIALDGEQYHDTITVTVAEDAGEPGVRFVSPTDGATVPPEFEVQMAASGLTVEPAGEIHADAGHMHILVDTDFVPAGEIIINDEQHLHFGKGQLTTTVALDPGVHVLRLQFANGAHIALEGEMYQDTITVTVAEDAAAQSVRFVAPQDGDIVSTTFTVETAATGLTLEPAGDIHPNAGHMHVLLDTDFVPAGELIIRDDEYVHLWRGEPTTTITLTPGVHVLRLQFSDSAHIALDGEQYHDTITVTVAEDAGEPGVRFVSPTDGATVPPEFEVQMAASGLTVEPAGEIHADAGHMHILVDTDFVPAGEIIISDEQYLDFGKGQLTATLALEPGPHTLNLQFANGAHIALEGEMYQDTITVTVEE